MPHESAWDELPSGDASRLERLCRDFEEVCKKNGPPRIEEYLGGVTDHERRPLFRELLALELAYRRKNGEQTFAAVYLERFPGEADLIRAEFVETTPDTRVEVNPIPHQHLQADLPSHLGRYQVIAKLGRGGFGTVYKGYDGLLQRAVAIKVPNKQRTTQPDHARAYVEEGRTLTGLDHPHIVKVYDLGETDDGMPFVVYEYIEGGDLEERMKKGRLPFSAAAEVAWVVADALHYVHLKHRVHRDIKPGNILINGVGKPYLADFGIAIRDEDFGKGPEFVGTLKYMSPEQARHESHRVDGRSDVFSVGVVLYELLTGRSPFQGKTPAELKEQIASVEARPLRMIDDHIPKELERICLKALAKKAVERYLTASDLAEDLRHFLVSHFRIEPRGVIASLAFLEAIQAPNHSPFGTPTPDPVKIVPKGIRSFDASDADFFLELLPGPCDRAGLPDKIRFWKTLIEQRDPDQSFLVGLIYGPSGCGKSSLVKAGLLPRLAGNILSVYIEATAEDTEASILKGLRKHGLGSNAPAGLVEVMNSLRHGCGIPAEKKVLIVLDQFEQWLHAKQGQFDTDLVRALRQCDGEHIQCLIMVRDDFWMATTQFMRELEIPILEGKNSAAVELFPVDHARRVLAHFGLAYGVLPAGRDPTPDQAEFLDRAVQGLAQEGKVTCVRLALFAEMMKDMPWTPLSLKSVGGTEGVGVAFLEETFSAAAAPLEHRCHQQAARAVLKELLPEAGTQIKGHMRSLGELLAASGYSDRPVEFAELIRILDHEIRLITPTDMESKESEENSAFPGGVRRRYYQLTHDYLVPSLSAWLTRKQKETSRGRAELRLAERAALWNAKPENRLLPSLREWASIRLLTRRPDWTKAQRLMMRTANRYHFWRLGILGAILILGGWGLFEGYGFIQASALMRELKIAETSEVERIVADLSAYRRWANPQLRQLLINGDDNSTEQRNAALALLPVDPGQQGFLVQRMFKADPDEVMLLRRALQKHQAELIPLLWPILLDRQEEPSRRFRAACALAEYDANNPSWDGVSRDVVTQLALQNPFQLIKWLEILRPAAGVLVDPLIEAFKDARRPDSERLMAANFLAEYAANRPDVLAECLKVAEPGQYAVLFPKLAAQGGQALELLEHELDKKLAPQWPDAPLASHWTKPEPGLVEQIERANGLVRERFAFCQTMPLEQLVTLAHRLRPSGYRPVCFRPYRAGDTVRCAAVWLRDDRPWRLAWNISAEEASHQDAACQKQGYFPLDVACYSFKSTEKRSTLRYAVLWSQPEPSLLAARLLVGIADGPNYRATCLQQREEGYVPRTLTHFEDGDQVWHSSVWWKPANPVDNPNYLFAASEAEYESYLTPSNLQVDIRLTSSPRRLDRARRGFQALLAWSAHGLAGIPWAPLVMSEHSPGSQPSDRDLSAVWWDAKEFVSAEARGADPLAHLERCRQLAARGFRPAAISLVCSGTATSPAAASVWHQAVVPESAKDVLARRQANAAVALLRMAHPANVWPLLKHSPDPTLRSYLIHRLAPLGANPETIIKRLDEETDVTIRRALLLSLGEYGEKELLPETRKAILPRIQEIYRNHVDPGLHAAAEWLLRQWQQESWLERFNQEWAKNEEHREKRLHDIQRLFTSERETAPPQWYINGQGQTMVGIADSREFWMGSPGSEPERLAEFEELRRIRIPRSFAIGNKEVTVEQFKRFLREHSAIHHEYTKNFSPESNGPITAVTWYEAAQYCRWLSEMEGVAEDQMCYPPVAEIKPGMRLRADYLERTGYRLPTQAEWEFACRAGAATSRAFGASDGLLEKYGWFLHNSQDRSWPGGRLKPNDLGLFDMHGNVREWCQDQTLEYADGRTWQGSKRPLTTEVNAGDGLVHLLRDGSFGSYASRSRVAYSLAFPSSNRGDNVGMRLARTYPGR
jgi:serine/threonine protein kinase/formylglycine-generating enzyme required for sulfatase activity